MNKRTYILALLCALATSARAQTPAPTDPLADRPVLNETLTVDRAVEVAVRESPMVRGAVAEVEAALGRLRAAEAERRPMVSANAFLSNGNNPGILTTPAAGGPSTVMAVPRDAFADLNLMVMLPVYTAGRIDAMVRQAAAMRRASEADAERQRQDVAMLTRMTFHEVQMRRAAADVQRARREANEERLRQDRARLAQEQIPAFYVQRSEAEMAATEQALVNAQRDVDIALVRLKTIMGVHPSSRLDVTGALASPSPESFLASLAPDVDTADPLPALRRAAQRQRPELHAAEQRVRGAAAEASAARAAYGPQVNVTLMGDVMKMGSEAAETGTTLGVVASLPLSTGGQRRARAQTADAMRRREEQERQSAALRVAEDVETALLNLRAAHRNIAVAEAGREAARAEYRAANLRYQSGRSVAVEALDALASQVRAESDVVDALFQYNTAMDQVMRAVGAAPATGTHG